MLDRSAREHDADGDMVAVAAVAVAAREAPRHDDPLSCDTSVVLNAATADGSVLFAKNSDRPPNECQPLTQVARRRHAPGASVQCQYLEIPQATETWEVIGSRPYWLWGFEMGVNEWGVAVGNEAVLTREPDVDLGLIGMDLVRLALERSATAAEAVAVIGDLIERHGQGGSCEADRFRTYHNSFIAADPTEAFVLETAGRRWVCRRVADRAAISNLLTVGTTWDAASAGLVEHARGQGWATGAAFDFAAAYQDPAADLTTRRCRLDRARQVLGGHAHPVTPGDMMALLRDHGDPGQGLPSGTDPLPTICMHAGPAWPGETAAAMVVHLRPECPPELRATCWTAFGSPCLGVFRPTYPFAVGLPASLDRGGAAYDPGSPWWVWERLQRMVARAPALAPAVADELRSLEATFVAEADAAEHEAARLLERGRRADALALLRRLVETTTERAVACARELTDDLCGVSERERDPVMDGFWSPLDRRAEVPR